MKKSILAVSAVAALSSAALADYTVSLPDQVFVGSGGVTVVTPALTGDVTGIIFRFSYTGVASTFSWASDMAATVGASQWGGYNTFVNGATIAEGAIGAPDSSAPVNFVSLFLPIGTTLNLSNQTLVVGYGNGYTAGSATMTGVSVTLVGSVPTPGAAAMLGLGGLAALRRRR